MGKRDQLSALLDRRSLQRLSDARSFERGEDYFEDDRVEALTRDEVAVTATVVGSRRYRVRLSSGRGELAFECSCPLGVDGEFCKHCVAVGLAWLEARSPGRSAATRRRRPQVTLGDLRAHLAAQERSVLVEMLMRNAVENDRLRQRLLLEVAAKRPQGLDVASFRRAIDTAVRIRGMVAYSDSYDYFRGVDEVIDSLQQLFDQGHADAVIELCEYALVRVDGAMESVDDSGGFLGGVLERLQALHLKACKKARPEPKSLARRLFEIELNSEFDVFFRSIERYAPVLGDEGVAEYRRLAAAEWAKVRALRAGEHDAEKYGRRFRITAIMEALAELDGDVDAMAAIKQRDLSSAHDFLEVAQVYEQAGNHELSLNWAERGRTAFPDRTDPRLLEFLAEAYHRRKRHDEAMALVWESFTNSPSLERYQNLKRHAERSGAWQSWRVKAIEHVRTAIPKRSAARKWSHWDSGADGSLLVEILLFERDVEAAWRAAKEARCRESLWLALAEKREKEHPDDALSVYQSRIEPTLAGRNDDSYRQAIHWLRKIRSLMARVGRDAAFPRFVEAVRAAHRPKRNFMRLLDREGWSEIAK